jgi:hypothetical protein
VAGCPRAGAPPPGANPASAAEAGVARPPERGEDPGRSSRGPPRGREIEVARITDDQRLETVAGPPQEAQLGEYQSRRRRGTGLPLVLSPFPDGHVSLGDLDAGSTQARDHLGVARIRPLIRPEVQDLQERISSTKASDRSRSDARSSWWLVISSVIRPSENTCRPTTTSSTPRISSGR